METEILKKVLDSLDSLCVVYDLNGNILGIYDSISDAARIVYGDVSHVSAIVANCKGKYNKCKGTVWRYEFDSFDKYSLENKTTMFLLPNEKI